MGIYEVYMGLQGQIFVYMGINWYIFVYMGINWYILGIYWLNIQGVSKKMPHSNLILLGTYKYLF